MKRDALTALLGLMMIIRKVPAVEGKETVWNNSDLCFNDFLEKCWLANLSVETVFDQ